MRSTQALVVAIAMAALLIPSHARADAADDDAVASLAWRGGIGVGMVTAASAGIVAALATDPLKAAKEQNPHAFVPSPTFVAITVGLSGLAIGLFCTVGAVVSVPNPR